MPTQIRARARSSSDPATRLASSIRRRLSTTSPSGGACPDTSVSTRRDHSQPAGRQQPPTTGAWTRRLAQCLIRSLSLATTPRRPGRTHLSTSLKREMVRSQILNRRFERSQRGSQRMITSRHERDGTTRECAVTGTGRHRAELRIRAVTVFAGVRVPSPSTASSAAALELCTA